MSRFRTVLTTALTLLFVVAACDQQQSQVLEPVAQQPQASHSSGCHATGTGLSAKVVNQNVIGQTIDVGDCDVGAFFDEDGQVRNATFVQPDDDPAPNEQYLVRVQGADVNVSRSEFSVNSSFNGTMIHVGYEAGATGAITDNDLTGRKRVGILLDGSGTSAVVKRNSVTGIGETTDGPAENGIQVSSGASGTVAANEVTDHWWDPNNFISAGIIVFGSDGVTVHHNELAGNSIGIALVGNENNAVHNTVGASAPDGSKDRSLHYGAWVIGSNNGLRHNEFTTSTSADIGILNFGSSVNTKLIGNTFSGGFGAKISDSGAETKLPDPFDPSS